MVQQKYNYSKYGWRKDGPDQRDLVFSLKEVTALPESLSLRSGFHAVYDQGQLGSCTANAVAGIFQFNEIKQNFSFKFIPSRLFIYYNERALVGQQDIDAGSSLRTGIKVVASEGVIPERQWPYDITKFTVQPPATLYQEAKKWEAIKYARVPQYVRSIQAALAGGYPICFGFTVYESFESNKVATTGIVPLPGPNEQVLGGHAVDIVGYKLINGHLYFEVRNSWGVDWGDNGYCWFPAAYMADTNLSSDYWVITEVS